MTQHYTFLQPGDVRQTGDEYFSVRDTQWAPSKILGAQIRTGQKTTFRRAVSTDAEYIALQARLVTLRDRIADAEQRDWPAALQADIDRLTLERNDLEAALTSTKTALDLERKARVAAEAALHADRHHDAPARTDNLPTGYRWAEEGECSHHYFSYTNEVVKRMSPFTHKTASSYGRNGRGVVALPTTKE